MKTKLFTLAVTFLISLTMTAQLDRSKRPKSGPMPKINLGNSTMFTLKNGLKVLVVENHKLPRVSATLTIDNSPTILGDKKGLDLLLGNMLGNGTTKITKDKYNEEVDFLGAHLNFWDSGARATSLTKYFDRIVHLMAQGVINPLFTKEEFKNKKDKLAERLKNEDKNSKVISRRITNIVAYGKKHPFGEFTTEKTLDNVSLNDVTNYYKTYYRPNNAYLIVVGDITVKDAKKLIKKQFSKWIAGHIPVTSLPELPTINKTTLFFVDMPNAVQSEITVLETANLKKKNSDYFDMLLANKILGGGATARLFMDLREDKGFTYGAYSRLRLRKYAPSMFSASASVRNVVTDSAVVAFMNEINKIRKEKITNTELRDAKASEVGSFVIALEKPETIARYELNIQRENLPKDFYATYLQKLNEVTINGIQLAVNKYIKPNKEAVIVVGKASDVLARLEKLPYPIVFLDKYGNITKKPVINIPIPKDVTVATVLNNYFKAIGGTDKVKAAKTAILNYEGTMQGMTISIEIKQMTPNSVSATTSMMGNIVQKQVFDGKTAYIEARGQRHEITGKKLDEMKSETVPFGEIGYFKTAKLLKIEPVDKNNAYVLQLTKKMKAFYAVKSGLKLKQVTTQKLPNGKDFVQVVSYSNYKAVDGILIPHIMEMKLGSQTVDFKLTSAKFNEGVTKADFK